MNFPLPRTSEERKGAALSSLLDEATEFSLHRAGNGIKESIAITRGKPSTIFRYEAELQRSRANRQLQHRDFAEFAQRLGLFEHYEVPILLGLVHDTIARTLAPQLALPFVDPATGEGSPFRYWKRRPLRDYSMSAGLRLESKQAPSMLEFVEHLWDGYPCVTIHFGP